MMEDKFMGAHVTGLIDYFKGKNIHPMDAYQIMAHTSVFVLAGELQQALRDDNMEKEYRDALTKHSSALGTFIKEQDEDPFILAMANALLAREYGDVLSMDMDEAMRVVGEPHAQPE